MSDRSVRTAPRARAARCSISARSTSRCVTARTVRGAERAHLHAARARARRTSAGGVGDVEDDDVGLDLGRVELDARQLRQARRRARARSRGPRPAARRGGRARTARPRRRCPAWRIAPPDHLLVAPRLVDQLARARPGTAPTGAPRPFVKSIQAVSKPARPLGAPARRRPRPRSSAARRPGAARSPCLARDLDAPRAAARAATRARRRCSSSARRDTSRERGA